jgi:RimJ/RimL family protein N-acetyltransferase
MTTKPFRPPSPRPARVVLEGRYTRLEPLTRSHSHDLFEASAAPGADERFAYLSEMPPASVADIEAWIAGPGSKDDPLFSAVIDRATGRCGGRQSLMRITPEHGVIEIGAILWGPRIARTRLATEALYLHARYAFETLGYRRFEWKCNDLNAPSKRAALRFGFTYEGLFRQHMWVKGANRDTAWFAMLDHEWPALRAEYERWLDPANFDAAGNQKTALAARSVVGR